VQQGYVVPVRPPRVVARVIQAEGSPSIHPFPGDGARWCRPRRLRPFPVLARASAALVGKRGQVTQDRFTSLFRPRTVVLGAMVALVATMLGATAIVARPQDPSVSGSGGPLHPAVDNTSRTADMIVTSTENTTIVSAVMDLGAKTHGCEVTASAEVKLTEDSFNVDVFSIGLDGTTNTVSSERRVHFVGTADFDVIWENAATNQGYDNLAGVHTFNFLVRNLLGAELRATTVTNATISVVCADRQL
jgi:hypothetical protein